MKTEVLLPGTRVSLSKEFNSKDSVTDKMMRFNITLTGVVEKVEFTKEEGLIYTVLVPDVVWDKLNGEPVKLKSVRATAIQVVDLDKVN